MSKRPLKFYEFGPFRLNVTERLLLRNREVVPLTPKVLDTLAVLVENSGHVLDKNELMQTLWPDSFVEESSLTQNISLLRRALGETDDGRQYIETMPKRGYRFVVGVRELDESEAEVVTQARTTTEILIEEEEHSATETIRMDLRTSEPIRRQFRFGLKSYLTFAAVLIIAAAGVYVYDREKTAQGLPPRSIAVLPFKPIGEGNNDELLGLGMADAIIARFSHSKGLSVIPTSSIFKYAGHDSDATVVGRELGVDAILTGTIQRAGERVRVSVQLVGLREGKTIWSDKFDERFTDIFALQDSISQRVAETLQLDSNDGREQLAMRHPANTDAYQSYLMGLYFWNKRSKESLSKAVDYFQEATDKDPNYASAFAELADTYSLLAYYRYEPQMSKELAARAKLFALKSLDLDKSSAEAYTAMAMVQSCEMDSGQAEQSYRRALDLNPSYATAHQRYAWFLVYFGRLNEAIEQMKRAQQLDPTSTLINLALGQVLSLSRQYDESIRYCKTALELEPDSDFAHLSLGEIYELKGMYREAITEFQAARAISDSSGDRTAGLGYALALTGQKVAAERALQDLRQRAKHEDISHYGVALLLAALGNKDQAVRELEEAISHEPFRTTVNIRFDPRLDPLRHDSTFNEFLREHSLSG